MRIDWLFTQDIDEDISGFWEHILAIPCYQTVVKEIINKYWR
jgi:hypothetical protein